MLVYFVSGPFLRSSQPLSLFPMVKHSGHYSYSLKLWLKRKASSWSLCSKTPDTDISNSVFLNHGPFCSPSPGDTWQYLEIFLIVTMRVEVLPSAYGTRPGLLLNTLQWSGQLFIPNNKELSGLDINSAKIEKPPSNSILGNCEMVQLF